jgi:hypothetical protein
VLDRQTNQETDRRGSNRFAIDRELRFKVTNRKVQGEVGQGRTINMSSTGILFTTDQNVLPGRTVEIAVSWPAQLNNKCPLKLVARGRVVRSTEGCVAIQIQHYEFRTLGSQGLTLAS